MMLPGVVGFYLVIWNSVIMVSHHIWDLLSPDFGILTAVYLVLSLVACIGYVLFSRWNVSGVRAVTSPPLSPKSVVMNPAPLAVAPSAAPTMLRIQMPIMPMMNFPLIPRNQPAQQGVYAVDDLSDDEEEEDSENDSDS